MMDRSITKVKALNNEYETPDSDEIDLRELLLAFIKGWRWIVGGVAIALALAVGYLAVAEDTYKTELRFIGSSEGLQMLNATLGVSYERDDLTGVSYERDELTQELISKLASFENFSHFLANNDSHQQRLIGIYSDDQAREEAQSRIRRFFFGNFSVNPPKKISSDASTSLNLSYGGALNGPELLNDLYRWTRQQFANQLVARAERAVEDAVSRNERQMQAHLENYRDDVVSRIERLEEQDEERRLILQDKLKAEQLAEKDARRERIRALKQAEQIADKLGIKKPTTPSALGRQINDPEVVYAEINSQGSLPLYFMGTEALASEREVIQQHLDENEKTAAIRNIEKELLELENNREIEVLKARKNAGSFVDEFLVLREENALLRSNLVSAEDIKISETLNFAYHPASPDSPKKALILVLAFMLGGMVGLVGLGISRILRSS